MSDLSLEVRVEELEAKVNKLEQSERLICTYKCPYCGEKLEAGSAVNNVYFSCKNFLKCPSPSVYGFYLSVDEIVAILNHS